MKGITAAPPVELVPLSTKPAPLPADAAAPSSETGGARRARHARRGGIYLEPTAAAALVVLLVALALANTRHVEVDWLVGSTRASLIWIMIVTAVACWVLGVLTAGVVRHRTRRASRSSPSSSCRPCPAASAARGTRRRLVPAAWRA